MENDIGRLALGFICLFPSFLAAQDIPAPPTGNEPLVGVAAKNSDGLAWSWEPGDELGFLAYKGSDDVMLLDAMCRDTSKPDVHRSYACGARDYAIEALFIAGICYGKAGQVETDFRLHRCQTGSRVPVQMEWWLN